MPIRRVYPFRYYSLHTLQYFSYSRTTYFFKLEKGDEMNSRPAARPRRKPANRTAVPKQKRPRAKINHATISLLSIVAEPSIHHRTAVPTGDGTMVGTLPRADTVRGKGREGMFSVSLAHFGIPTTKERVCAHHIRDYRFQ